MNLTNDTTLDLINQLAEAETLQPHVDKIVELMELRVEMWKKLSPESRRQWLVSRRDPVLNMVDELYNYLNENYRGTHGIQEAKF